MPVLAGGGDCNLCGGSLKVVVQKKRTSFVYINKVRLKN